MHKRGPASNWGLWISARSSFEFRQTGHQGSQSQECPSGMLQKGTLGHPEHGCFDLPVRVFQRTRRTRAGNVTSANATAASAASSGGRGGGEAGAAPALLGACARAETETPPPPRSPPGCPPRCPPRPPTRSPRRRRRRRSRPRRLAGRTAGAASGGLAPGQGGPSGGKPTGGGGRVRGAAAPRRRLRGQGCRRRRRPNLRGGEGKPAGQVGRARGRQHRTYEGGSEAPGGRP